MQDINVRSITCTWENWTIMLSHEMKRNQPIDKVIKADLTIMQKHILKFILLETMHKDLYQKDIEEEFQILQINCDRICTVDGEEWISDKRKCQRRC